MGQIIPHLWFDKVALQAAEFYTSVFPDSNITNKTTIKDTPGGDCDIVGFDIFGFHFMAMNAGPMFKINPSISFTINLDTEAEIESIWHKLSQNGKIMMELNKYPFSDFYGWVEDQFGVSWQLIIQKPNIKKPKVITSLMFTQKNVGKAEEAIHFYTSIFPDSNIDYIFPYEGNEGPDQKGTVAHAELILNHNKFIISESAYDHAFVFNEAISLIVQCKDQEEINYYWGKLSAVPESEKCGWLKDKYGISWQIIPENMGQLMSQNPEKTTPIMLKMKKIIIKDLKEAGK